MKKLLFILPAVVAFSLQSAHGAAITVSADIANGLSAAGGTDATDDLPAGNLIRVGYFNLTDAQIQANANNLTFLNSNWVEFGFTTVGTGVGGVAGHFASLQMNRPDSDTAGFANKQIYLWVFDSTNNTSEANSIATAFQQGIFSMNLANKANWRIPGTTEVPNDTSVDLADLTGSGHTALATGADVVIGTFPKGTSAATSSPNFGLAVISVPEPASAGLAILGGAAMLLHRRRRSA